MVTLALIHRISQSGGRKLSPRRYTRRSARFGTWLRTKLARTGLSFDLVRLDSDEEERLKAADFVRCCRALTWRPAT